MKLPEKIETKFKELFNDDPLLVRSPGRVNLIGEHTDYNMGSVLPAAIDKAIYFAISPRKDNKCKIFSVDMDEEFNFGLDNIKYSDRGWPNYLMGVVDQFNNAGYKLNGFNCVFGGDIPIGAGLSSSAALETGLAFSLNNIFDLGIDKLTLVKLAQKAENEFVGVECGIMDQYINIFGESGNVLRIDCRSLEYEYFPFDYSTISIVLFDTGVSHSLASSEYNNRRKECGEGVELISKYFSHVKSLRDVTMNQLNELKSQMKPVIFKRCKYVVEENDRMIMAGDALNNRDLTSFGNLMYQTHEGLSKDYEVSCDELDYLVELTKGNPKVYGSRMMGGGFGGCTINLIENNEVEKISSEIKQQYRKRFNRDAEVYVTQINSGTSVIPVNENV